MKKTVMLIDDEEDFCFFLKQNLEATGEYNVVTSHNGTDGAQQVRSIHPDLILLDVMMPGISGADVASQLKQDTRTRNIPVVFLTAIVEEQEIQARRNQIGGWLYVSKPVKVAELVGLIKQLTA